MIYELPQDLINKIAAGEVIERPASVVKELIENSIDANSTQITIDIENGGKSLIRITDNGTGMSKEDLVKAPLRHTTSKIKTVHDLFKITTLGFRGEALASIGAVSSLKIKTKQENQDLGYSYEINYDQKLKLQECQTSKGTIIEIEDLFRNLPARLKYLKADYLEFQHILDLVTKYALAFPEIHFRLTNNSKEVLNSPSTTSLNNITAILGKDISKHLIEINTPLIQGYISKPILTRMDKSNQIIFVNKRYIRNKLISDAVNQAYSTVVHHSRFPVFILDIKLSPLDYDVNVHPQKYEIRIKNEKEIYDQIYNTIKETLNSEDLIPEPTSKGFELKPLLVKKDKNYFTTETQNTLSVEEEKTNFKILGQAHKTYIFVETQEGVFVIDQHALQERIFYNEFVKEKSEIQKQSLVSPKILELSAEEFQIAKDNLSELMKLGFVLEEFGINTYKLLSVPIVKDIQMPPEYLTEIISNIKNNSKTTHVDSFKDRILKYMSCRGAIKAGDILTLSEMKNLVKQLENLESTPTCPHGRPIVLRYTLLDLEKMFQRKL